MSTLYLIRHGETDWNRLGRLQGIEDIELNGHGEQQAHQCGSSLKHEPIDLIFSSPLKRAYKTAQIINEYLGLPKVQKIEGLHERDFGIASGLTKEERENLYPDGQVPGMEAWEELKSRAMQSIEQMIEQYPKERLLVVTHGGVINAILHTISQGEIGTGITRLKNTCLSVLHFHHGQWQIEKHNCTQHLL